MNLSGYSICHVEDGKKYEILREKRVVLGMTQQQVADKAKITIRQYQEFESGDRNIMTASFQLACKVIEALGMDAMKIYHGDYAIGEKVYLEDGVLKYEKTGKWVNEDVE